MSLILMGYLDPRLLQEVGDLVLSTNSLFVPYPAQNAKRVCVRV